MGCGSSKAKEAYEAITKNPHYQQWALQFQALQLTQTEVKKLHSYFFKADMDNGGTIELVELLTVIDVERTKFTERVFSIFDEDGSGKIDFGEFVLALWNYCTLSKVILSNFAFDLYDRDGTGQLEEHDLEGMLKDIYGKEWKTNHYSRAVQKELRELIAANKEIDLQVFTTYTQTHHSLLFPAFQLQLLLRTKIMGTSFWENHCNRRVRLSNNKYIKIKDFLILTANKDLKGINEILAPKAQVLAINTGSHYDRVQRKKKLAEEQARAEMERNLKNVTSPGGSEKPPSNHPRRRSFDNATTATGTAESNEAPAGGNKRKSVVTPATSNAMNELDQLISQGMDSKKEPAGKRRGTVAAPSKPSSTKAEPALTANTADTTPNADISSETPHEAHGGDMAAIQAAIAAKNRVKNRRRSL